MLRQPPRRTSRPLGAGTTADSVQAAGAEYLSRIITSPDGDIAEDQTVTTTGNYTATATNSGADGWVMQMATFRCRGQATGNPAPAVTSTTPNTGTADGGTSVTITGTGFRSGLTVSLGGTAATGVRVVNSTSITAITPAHAAGTVNVVVTNNDAQSGTLPGGFTYIALADFTLTASTPWPATVAAGGSVTSTITINPLNGFNGTLSLSCSSIVPAVTLPPTCTFAPSSVTSSGTSTLTVRTTLPTQASLVPRSRSVFYGIWLPVEGLLLLGAGLPSRRRRSLCFLFGCVLFSGLGLLTACGGGSSSFGGSATGIAGTPTGIYTITISASGSMTHTTAVTLTVK